MYDFAVLGGDMRQSYMAKQLSDRGFSVITYGIMSEGKQADSMEEAVVNAKVLIGPIPFSKDRENIVSMECCSDFGIEDIKRCLQKGQSIFAGCIPDDFCGYCRDMGVAVHDFMKLDSVALKNAVPTAEGAVAEAVFGSPHQIQASKCLVLGFGRCGSVLAEKLKLWSADVTVAARNAQQRALAESLGMNAVSLEDMKKEIPQADFIFNTIPSLVLDRKCLELARTEVLIVDIASAPGGVDFEAAEELGVDARLCLGIPGKYAAYSAAAILTETMITEWDV
ncbi:dipicolinate synthase subunit DpsA [Anaerostipes sp.]|uniref:dipicolinate synthase subunit DpsA n=1 Tax=Anaerostipes sp. TaxID=1872530 RepID=UPI0025C6C0FA|nr:dipicolinate synthase subunit DpsA [Anaerostipes sp.]